MYLHLYIGTSYLTLVGIRSQSRWPTRAWTWSLVGEPGWQSGAFLNPKVWKHSSWSWDRKVQSSNIKPLLNRSWCIPWAACVIFQGSSTSWWFSKSWMAKGIFGIPPAYISRVPNTEVLRRACYPRLQKYFWQDNFSFPVRCRDLHTTTLLHIAAFIQQPEWWRPRRERITLVRDKATGDNQTCTTSSCLESCGVPVYLSTCHPAYHRLTDWYERLASQAQDPKLNRRNVIEYDAFSLCQSLYDFRR